MQSVLEAVGSLALLALYLLVLSVLVSLPICWVLRHRILRQVGRLAMAAQPREIHLEREPESRWRQPEVVAARAGALVDRGFVQVGVFTIRELADVRVVLLLAPDRRSAAAIYEHGSSGVWLDLWAQNAAGESAIVTDNQSVGALAVPPWRRLAKLPEAGVEALLGAFARMKLVEPIELEIAELPRRFEDEWRREVAWRSARGVRASEVATVEARTKAGGP